MTMGCSKTVLSIAMVMIGVFVFTGVAGAAETIKLGVAGAHSGDLASYGLPTKRAAELVVKDINAKGGILGRQVEILAEDDACKPEVATNTATKTALGIYNEAGMVTMSSTATSPELTQSGKYPRFFRTIAPDDAQAKVNVNFVLKGLKVKKIDILHDKGDYGKGFAEYAKPFIHASPTAKMVLFEGITPGAVDYSAVVQKIRQSGAEAVIFGGYHPEAASIVSQMRDAQEKHEDLFCLR